MSSSSLRIASRLPNETEETLLLKYDVLGHLNAFAKWLAVPLGWPLNGSWRDLKRKDIGIVEDEELEDLNSEMSVVAPFLPAKVGYKFARPVTAWTPTCANQSPKHQDNWWSRVENEGKHNVGYNPKMPNSIAFPRFLKYRQIAEDGKLRQMIIKENMQSFREGDFKVTLRTVNGLQPRWTQLACRHDYDASSRFYDKGDRSKQLENGMPCSSDITYLRLDLHAQSKPGGDASEEPVFSCIFRGVIVQEREDSRNWRAWNREDKILQTFKTLKATLSDHVFSAKPIAIPSKPTSPHRPEPRGRSRSPDPADVRHQETDHRRRSIDPPNRRTPPPPPRGVEHTLSHRRRRMYGFLE